MKCYCKLSMHFNKGNDYKSLLGIYFPFSRFSLSGQESQLACKMQLGVERRSEGTVRPEGATKAGRLLNERCFLFSVFFFFFCSSHLHTNAGEFSAERKQESWVRLLMFILAQGGERKAFFEQVMLEFRWKWGTSFLEAFLLHMMLRIENIA